MLTIRLGFKSMFFFLLPPAEAEVAMICRLSGLIIRLSPAQSAAVLHIHKQEYITITTNHYYNSRLHVILQ